MAEAAAAFNQDPLGWVLGGGEDHALLATFPAGGDLPEGFTVVGAVHARGRPACSWTARRTRATRGTTTSPARGGRSC